MQEDTFHGEELMKWFGPPEKIRSHFEKAYSPENLHLELTNSAEIENFDGERELWISGKCIALRRDVWEAYLEELRFA